MKDSSHRTAKIYKAIEFYLRDLPKPDFDLMCNYLNIKGIDLKILQLKYRNGSDKFTREYIAEECAVSPSTVDRYKKRVLEHVQRMHKTINDSLNLSVPIDEYLASMHCFA